MKPYELYEAPMNPSNFAAAIEQGQVKGVLVGYEFEVCVPKKTITKAKKLPKPEFNYLERIEYILSEEDPFYSEDILDIPLSAMELHLKPKLSVAKFNSYLEALNSMFQRSLPEIKLLFEKVPEKVRRKAIPLAQEKVNEMRQIYKGYPEELLFTYQFGRAVNATTRGYKFAELANDIRYEAQIGYNDLFEEMFGVSYNIVSENLTNYFDFDPKKLYKAFFQDYDTYDEDDDDYNDEVDYDYSGAVKALYPAVTQAFGKTHIFNEYHQNVKNLTDWYIEPDGSLNPNGNDGAAEIVSPPMPAKDSIVALKKFYGIAKQLNLYTSKKNKTGLHINVSIPQQLDVLKLAVFLGDQHVLQQFGRQNNRYATSVTKDLSASLKRRETVRGQFKDANIESPLIKDPAGKDPLGREGVQSSINFPMLKELVRNISDEHFASINYNGKYVSFRHAGGNYISDPNQIINVVGRFIRAMIIASDPNAYVEEYKSKLAKLTYSATNNLPNDSMAQDVKSSIDYIKTNGVPLLVLDIMKFKPTYKPKNLVFSAMSDISLNFEDEKTQFDVTDPKIKTNIVSKLVNPELKKMASEADSSMFVRAYVTVNPTVVGILGRLEMQPGVNYIENDVNFTQSNVGLVYAHKMHITANSGMGQQILRSLNITYAKIAKKEAQLAKRREADRKRRLAKKSAPTSPAPAVTEAGGVPTYYFAYGMLTDPTIMNGVKLVGKATLENFSLEMLHFANVVPTKGGRVFGCLWEVDREIISNLDRIEGYPHLYDRKTVPVNANSQRYVAEIYTMTPHTRQDMAEHPPTQDYINKIARGYKNAEIPMQQLKNALR